MRPTHSALVPSPLRSLARAWPLVLLAGVLCPATTLAAETAPAHTDPGPDLAVFRAQVQPLLAARCLNCHGASRQRGGLDLSRRATALAGGKSGHAVVPGDPEASLLYRKVAAGDMPPQNPLPPEQVAAVKKWLASGAPYADEPLTAAVQRAGPDWWSLQPIARPAPPRVRDSAWVRTPLDAFILAKLEEQGLHPAPEADRATLLRRVYFDLLGLPPAPEDVEAFVHDPHPDAYEHLVDRLLAAPQYGERWGRHWLDVVRFAESQGYETNELRPNAWPYRDYVIRAFNDDTPYPRFILEQLAGDTLEDSDGLTQAATGFLVGGAHDTVGNGTREGQLQQRMDDLDDMITATGGTFLGLTTNCARCHDHKFDPIGQRDYYGLQAVFAGVQHAEREVRVVGPGALQEANTVRAELDQIDRRLDDLEPLADPARKTPARPAVQPRRNVERFAPVEARFIRFTVLATGDNSEPCLDELEAYTAEETPRNVALAGTGVRATASSTYANNPLHRLEHINDGRYGNGRSWISAERGAGWVQIELPHAETIDRIVWGRDREVKYLDRLAVNYRVEVAQAPGAWRVVASSADRLPYPSPPGSALTGLSSEQQRQRSALLERRASLEKLLPSLNPVRRLYAGTFTQPGPTHVLTRGDPMRPGDAVAPSALAVIRPPLAVDANAPESERRLALARWLGRDDNPLPARVMVNRVWQYHFGQGIVDTPSDFGSNGGRPSHPELLDWLARAYIDNGWRLKPLHRLMLLSATYRQSGQLDAKALEVDRQNRLLWRRTPHRLEAESLRDAILAVSGNLDLKMGGAGYYLWEQNTNYVVVFKPKAQLGPDEFRRMVYQFKPRSQQDPTFGVFDCPDAALARPRRTVSTTVLQALNLLNSQLVVSQSETFAQRLQREAGADPERQARRAFALAFGRDPTAAEQAAAAALIRTHGTAALCRALYNANEFLYVD